MESDSKRTDSEIRPEGLVETRARSWPPRWLPPIAVVVVLILWPIVAIGARQAWQKSKNRVEDWLPARFSETKSLREFETRFGSDEFLMISWPGCTLGDPRATLLTEELRKPSVDGKVFFGNVDSGAQVVESLVKTKQFTEEQAKRRVTGIFVGPDGKQSCVVARVSEAGASNRGAAMEWARNASEQATQLPLSEIHIAGTTADSVAVDEASNAWLVELNLLSYAVCFGILIFSLRNIWLVGTLVLTAMFHQQLALAVIYFSGGHVDSVQLLVANLCFVLTISAGLHYLGYFRDALRARSESPASTALRQAFWPSMLASVTTSLGFVSLCASALVPIRSFGFYAAVLVPINSMIVIGLLSVHATWSVRRNWRFQKIAPPRSGTDERIKDEPQSDFWSKVGIPILSRRPLAIVVAWMWVMIAIGAGVTKLKTNVGTHQLLPSNSKLIQDYAWLEKHVGALVPVELVMRMPLPDDPNASETFGRIQTLKELQERFREVAGIEGSFSV
ncbi:MAG: MMPL family transporter, partial [Pirellula sp.]